jgi:predicted dehydrogenase
MEGKTVVAIAHRLSTIAAMDRLIVMDAGPHRRRRDHAEPAGRSGGCMRGCGRTRAAASSASTDLAALVSRDDVQAVYVCTPHPHHAAAVRAALLAGKAVLCEKPLTPFGAATRPLVALAAERGVFLMEAVWTRFLPVYGQVRSWLDAAEIGAVRAMYSDFVIDRPPRPGDRRYTAALGGGALLDIGIYNITVSRMVLPGGAGAGLRRAREAG